jgi:hypothetical protein
LSLPIHIIVDRIKRLSLAQQIYYLRAKLNDEPLRSVRRNELESLLRGKMQKQLRRENRLAS